MSETITATTSTNTSTQQRRTSATKDGDGTQQNVTDGGCELHDPHLYDYEEIIQPNGSWIDIDKTVKSYNKDGFIVFDETTFKNNIPDLLLSINNLTCGQNIHFTKSVIDLVQSGNTPNFTAGAKIPWVQYEAGTLVDNNNNILHPSVSNSVRKLMGFVGYESAIDNVVNDERLLQIVSKLLQCEISELELFQDMALLKPPYGREKPWHQDKAYFNIPVDAPVVGCWLALDDATPENGCMRMQRGQHKNGPQLHYAIRDYQLCDNDIDKTNVVVIPIKSGGFVLFDGLIPHGTPRNNTNTTRRALQFHWTKRNVKVITVNERTKIYGGIEHGLSC